MKLKHRITGSILALAFAVSSALPAATIPQIKRAPAVKVPTVPKVPVAPKVPTVPKVRTVKVPTVKVPTTPKVRTVKVPTVKVPTTPKVRTVKIPTVKAPPTSKKPAVVKTPVKIPSSTKTAIVPTQRKVETKSTSTQSVVMNQGIRQAVRGARQDNPNQAPEAGVKPNLPDLPVRDANVGGRSSDKKPGIGGRSTDTNVLGALLGKGGSTSSSGLLGDLIPKRDVPALTGISQAGRTFDQGFGSATPDLSGFNAGSFSPMAGITAGGSIGGLLGAAADQAEGGSGGSGLAGMGSSLISVDPGINSANAATVDENGEVKARGDAKGAFEWLKSVFGLSEEQANTAVKRAAGIGENRNGFEFLDDPYGDPAAKNPSTPKGTGEDGETSVHSSDLRNFVFIDENKTRHVYVNGKEVGTITSDGKITPVDGVEMPDPENGGAVKVDVISQSPGLLQQIAQSRSGKTVSQGGTSDATPVDDAINNVANGLMITQQSTTRVKNNMLGNPGQFGGVREGGSATVAPVRSNGSGVVTPTDDQNMSSSGGRQEDAGKFFGNGVGPDQSRINGSSSSSSNSSSDNESSSSSSSSSKSKKK